MSRKFLTGVRKEIYYSWEAMMKVAKWKGNQYEGVHIEPRWLDFELFIADNWIRYYRAKIKWQNYQRVAPREDQNLTGPLKLRPVWFTRKVKEFGYTLENTVWTNPSDGTKYASNTHKLVLDDKLLGTRDIKNILKKKGINVCMETITDRFGSKKGLFNYKEKCIKHKNAYRNLAEIASMENVTYHVLKRAYYKHEDIKKAIKEAKKSIPRTHYTFEGKMLLKSEVAQIIAKREGKPFGTIYSRMKKYGLNMNALLAETYSKPASVKKKVIATNINTKEEIEFESIAKAAELLGLHGSNISLVASGKYKKSGNYYFRYM